MNSTPLNNNTDEEEDPFDKGTRLFKELYNDNETPTEETVIEEKITEEPVVENQLLSTTPESVQEPTDKEVDEEEEDPFDKGTRLFKELYGKKETAVSGQPTEEGIVVDGEERQPSDWDTLRGLETAARQTPQLAYGVVGLLGETAEQLTGVGESVRDWGLRGYREWEQSIEPISKETDDITIAWKKAQEGDIGALVDWAQYGIGYGLGQIGESAAVAVLGGLAAGAVAAPSGPGALVAAGAGAAGSVVAKQGFKALAKESIEKLIAKQSKKLVEEQAAKQGIKLTAQEVADAAKDKAIKKQVAQKLGSDIAVIGNATGMQLGSIYGEAKQKADDEGRELTGVDLARIWGTGLATGGIDGFTDKLGLDVVRGRYLDKLPGGRLTRAATGGALGVAVEGATEGIQTVGERYGAGKELTTDEAINEYINAIALGGLTGGAVGGVGGLVSREPVTPKVRNTAGTRINLAEQEAVRQEQIKAQTATAAAADPTKTATERLQTKSKELEQKNIPNQALKVVEEQIKEAQGTPTSIDKSADDILTEKAEQLAKTDTKAAELDEQSKTQLNNVAQNKASKEDIKSLKDKGYAYEVEGQLVITEEARLGMGQTAPRLSEKARLEEVRDRYNPTNEELNNSTDAELLDSLNRGRTTIGKLDERTAGRVKQGLEGVKNELRRRAQGQTDVKGGFGQRNLTMDSRFMSTFDTEQEATNYIETQLNEATKNNNSVDIVTPTDNKVRKVVGVDKTTNRILVSDADGVRSSIPLNDITNGNAKIEIFDPAKARSRKGAEISDTTQPRVANLTVVRPTDVTDVDIMDSTPLGDSDPVRGNQVEASRKAAVLRNANASNTSDFLANLAKQGGIKGRVAELLAKIGVGNVKITIGRFGRSKDPKKRFAGSWNKKTNEIIINLDERDSYTNADGSHDVLSTLLHELGHAALYNKLQNKETLDPAESKAIGEIEKIYNEFVKKYADSKSEYSVNTQQVFDEGVGFQEFVSELLVNPELQSLVENMGPGKSTLQKLLQLILNFIQGKELNPFSNLSQAWKALNTLTGKPAVTAEAEVTPTGEAELLSPAVIEENIDSINRMVLSEENIPSAESGILSKLLSASYEIKKLYNGYINQAFINPKTKVDEIVDFIGKTYGIDLLNKKGAIAPSTFLNKITGIREFNPTNLISFTGPNARRNSMIYGLIRSIATKQNGTATYTKDNKGNKVGVSYNFGANMTPNISKQVSDVINAVLVQNNAESASGDIALYPRADGIDVVHLGLNPKIKKEIRNDIFTELNSLNKQLTGMSNKVKEFNVTADYVTNDWSKQKKGKKYYEEIDKLIREHPEYKEPASIQDITDRGRIGEKEKGISTAARGSSRRRSDLLRRWMESRITPRITTINAQFSAKGYGNIGADYQVIKVNTPNGDAYIKYYPSAVNLPPLKELESIAGELIAIGEMDTQDADGITMGGGMYPFLLSNDIILTDKDGNKYRVVWANQGTATKNTIKSKIINETTSGYMAMHIMQPESQATNAQFFEGILETIVNSNLTAPQLEAVEVISGIVSPKKSNTDYKTQVANLKELNEYVNELVKAEIDSDKINLVNQKYSGKTWYQTNLKNFNERKSNLDFIKKNTTFNSRGLVIGRLKKLKFLGDQIIDKLAQSSDFVNVPSLQIASVVQMSQRPEAFAVWTGKMDLEPTEKWTADDLKAYNDMTETEKDLRKQLINSGKFIAHKSYDWAILGSSDANNFILKTPVQAEQAFTIEMTGDKKELRIQEEPETIDTYNSRNLYTLKRGKNINIRVKKKISKPVKTQSTQLQEVQADRRQLLKEAGIKPLAPKEEKDLYSPATDTIKRVFTGVPKTSYTKDFTNALLRLFTTGNKNTVVAKGMEWIEGRLNRYRYEMESVVERLERAAKLDGINIDDVEETMNKALARSADPLTPEQIKEVDRYITEQRDKAISQWFKGETEIDPLGTPTEGVAFTLPEELKKSSPRYGKAKVKFMSDFDRVAYILASDETKPSKAAAKFRKAILDAGFDLDEVIAHGNKVKAELKKQSGGTAPKTAMDIDLQPQPYDGKQKPFSKRKVKSRKDDKAITEEDYSQVRDAIDKGGLDIMEAIELVLGKRKFNSLKEFVRNITTQARIDKELELNKQNLDRAYKEADDALNALPENLRNQILEARAELFEVTGGVVHDGVIPPNARVVIDGKNVNVAIKEAYYAEIDENFLKKLRMDPERMDALLQYIQNVWVDNMANQIQKDSKKFISLAEARELAVNKLNRETDEGKINLQNILESFLTLAKTSPTRAFEEVLVPTLNMTPEQSSFGLSKALKEALGRVEDNVGYTYISIMHNIAQEITYSEGFNMMKEAGLKDGWVVDIKSGNLIPEGYVPIEKSNIPGFSRAFEGMMVDPLFKEVIESTYDSSGKMDGIQRVISGANSLTLAAATSLSLPRGPIRNFFGNIVFYVSAGRLDPRPLARGFKLAIAALQRTGDPKVVAKLKRLIELNLIDQDVTMDILKNSLKGVKNEDINMLENIGETLDPSKISKVMKGLNRIYQLPDNLWKIALQLAEETTLTEAYANGIPAQDAGTESDIAFGTPEFEAKIEELAADRVKESMPAYSRMNAIGRYFRKPGMRSFVAPFIGFTSEVFRVTISNFRLALKDMKSTNPVLRKSGFKRMAGMMAAYSSFAVLASMTKALFGIGDDEEEAARRTLAPWDQNAELIFWRDKDRNLKYFNTSFMNPVSFMSFDAWRAARRNYEMNDDKGVVGLIEATGRGLWEMFGAYVDPQIFTKKAIEAYSNVSDNNRPVYNPESGAGQISWDVSGHLISGIIPGTINQGWGLINAIMGKEDGRGEIPGVTPALFNAFLARSGDVRPKEAFKYKSIEINRRKRDSASIITSLIKRRGPVSEGEIIKAYNQANQAYYNVLSDAHRLYNDQLVLGTSKRDILNLLKEAKLSSDDIRQIRLGVIQPYEVADTTLREIPRDRAIILRKLYREQKRKLASDRKVLTNPKGTNRPNQ